MLNLKINGQPCQVPNKFEELTLVQFCDIIDLLSNGKEGDKFAGMLDIIYSVDEGTFLDLPVAKVNELASEVLDCLSYDKMMGLLSANMDSKDKAKYTKAASELTFGEKIDIDTVIAMKRTANIHITLLNSFIERDDWGSKQAVKWYPIASFFLRRYKIILLSLQVR